MRQEKYAKIIDSKRAEKELRCAMTANWQEYFSKDALEEGRVLYGKKAVKGFVSTKDSCMARVLGDRVYDVSIRRFLEGMLSMGCNCARAQAGKNCAHMAAVLFLWQERQGDSPDADQIPALVEMEDAQGNEETFFRLRKMAADLKVSPEVKRQANEILEEGSMRVDFFRMHYGKDGEADSAWAEFQTLYEPRIKDQKKAADARRMVTEARKVYFRFSRDHFLDMECGCCHRHIFSYWTLSVCPHEMAAVYLLQDYIRQYNPGDATDEKGDRFLSAFSDSAAVRRDEGREAIPRIRLLPRLTEDERGFALSFRIGVGRLYVVKNLTDLVDQHTSGGSLPLGKKDALHFHQETFTEASARVYDFIRRQVKANERLEERLRKAYSYDKTPSFCLTREIRLEGEAADFLYDYLQTGQPAEIWGRMQGSGSKSLQAGKHFPQIRLRIDPFLDLNRLNQKQISRLYLAALPPEEQIYAEDSYPASDDQTEMREELREWARPEDLYQLMKDKGEVTAEKVQGLILTGNLPTRIQGRQASYVIYEGTMVRFAGEDEESLTPLMNAAEGGYLRLCFGKKHLAEFYYRVLPHLEENPRISIQESADFSAMGILPEEAEFSFRLDIEGGLLLADGKVSYGDRSFSLLPAKERREAYDSGRDQQQEERALALLQSEFPQYESRWSAFYTEATDDAVYELLDSGLARLERLGRVEGSEAFRKLTIRSMPQVRIGVSVRSSLMDLDISSDDLTTEELLELLEAYRRKKSYHKLKSGSFVRLEQEGSMQMLTRLMEDTGMEPGDFTEGKMHLPLYRALYINKMLEDHDAVAADRDRNFRELIKEFKTVEESDFEVPRGLSKVLRKYQTYGYKWIRTLAANHFGGILADDMGLGKTLQMISVLAAEKESPNREKDPSAGGPSLVICPASLVYNWQEEFTRFAPELAVVPVTGFAGQRRKLLDDCSQADVLITSYDLLKRDISLYEKIEFDFQVLDEAQYIKNPQAAVSKAVKIIKSRHRFALTGTPIENRLSELWSIFDFLMPGFLYSYEDFRTDFELPIAREEDQEVIARLRRMTGPFILRRLKRDVLKDLPAKIEEVRYARLEGEQRRLYDAQVARMRAMIAGAGEAYNRNKIQVLAELTKIRQICCDPSIFVEGYRGKSAKRKACLDLIGSAIDGGHKMLVFSQFTSMLALLEEDLSRAKIPFYKITGATGKEERLRLVHAFNDDETPVFLISLKAGGTGLNLTGADLVIHYDPWWNLAAQNQATDRAHRIGQTKDVSVFRLIAKGTIEDRILEMQEKKKDLADAILSGQSESLGQLSKEELLELLG